MKCAVFDLLHKKKYLVICFLVGVIIGIVAANVQWYKYSDWMQKYSEYWMVRVKQTDIDKSEFQKYVFKYRIKELLMLLVFNITIIGRFFNYAYFAYCGYSVALMESGIIMRCGIKGILRFLKIILPHYIVYMLIIIFAVNEFEKINRKIFDDKRKNDVHLNEILVRMIALIIVLTIFVWIESLLEAYVNTWIYFI